MRHLEKSYRITWCNYDVLHHITKSHRITYNIYGQPYNASSTYKIQLLFKILQNYRPLLLCKIYFKLSKVRKTIQLIYSFIIPIIEYKSSQRNDMHILFSQHCDRCASYLIISLFDHQRLVLLFFLLGKT